MLAGLRDVLDGHHGDGRSPFDIVTGTSVGAINAAHVAGSADLEEHGVPALLDIWTSLRVDMHLRPQLGGFLGWSRKALGAGVDHDLPSGPRWGRALLDVQPFEHIVEHRIPWERVHENVRRGVVHAVVVSALNVANGRTVSFVEIGPNGSYVPSPDASRVSHVAPISADHVLASAAIPLLFPARRVGDSYFCDGGLRFNTPISPAIRAGAERLLIVALRAGTPEDERTALEQYPNPIFLLGKIFNALLLDPIDHDLQVLQRFNRMLEVLETQVAPSILAQVEGVLQADRGLPYRRLRSLVFRPSEDISVLALDHLRAHRTRLCRPGGVATVLLENLAALGEHVEADLLSYLLFDGDFARTLIELGRSDVKRRAAEVEAFFADEEGAERAASSEVA